MKNLIESISVVSKWIFEEWNAILKNKIYKSKKPDYSRHTHKTSSCCYIRFVLYSSFNALWKQLRRMLVIDFCIFVNLSELYKWKFNLITNFRLFFDFILSVIGSSHFREMIVFITMNKRRIKQKYPISIVYLYQLKKINNDRAHSDYNSLSFNDSIPSRLDKVVKQNATKGKFD